MSIDYEAEFGIGFEVEIDEQNPPNLDEYDDSLYEFMVTGIVGSDEFKDFYISSIGNACIGERQWLITINKPFKEIAKDADRYESLLRQLLQRNHLKPVGEFGLVGGLYIS